MQICFKIIKISFKLSRISFTTIRNFSAKMNGRGAFIVFEGCDRSGKSTQCQKLAEYLCSKNIKTETMKFPDRTTETGKLINQYLTGSKTLDDHVIHLLFSANRWEAVNEMKNKLLQGITLVVDRYSFSGVAFSAAKPGMNLNWCMAPEVGLIRPDLVLMLRLNEKTQQQRPGYGNEVYENPEFQRAVNDMYAHLRDETWRIIDADGSIDEVHDEIVRVVNGVFEDAVSKDLLPLW